MSSGTATPAGSVSPEAPIAFCVVTVAISGFVEVLYKAGNSVPGLYSYEPTPETSGKNEA